MHNKHDAQTEVRGNHKAAKLNDVLQVRTCNDFGHQSQDTVRRQLHDQTHQLHHPALQGIDGRQNALAFRRIVLQQLQRSHAQECREDHHADNGGWACAGQVSKRVLRNEGEHHLRNGQIGHFTHVVGLNRRQTRGFSATLHQTFSSQAKQIGYQHTHQRRNQRGEEQGTNGQEADFTQLRGIVQAGYGAQNRGEYQRHNDHLQQLYIAVTDNVEPLNGVFQYRAVGAVNSV